jgi:hypothetical protein
LYFGVRFVPGNGKQAIAASLLLGYQGYAKTVPVVRSPARGSNILVVANAARFSGSDEADPAHLVPVKRGGGIDTKTTNPVVSTELKGS